MTSMKLIFVNIVYWATFGLVACKPKPPPVIESASQQTQRPSTKIQNISIKPQSVAKEIAANGLGLSPENQKLFSKFNELKGASAELLGSFFNSLGQTGKATLAQDYYREVYNRLGQKAANDLILATKSPGLRSLMLNSHGDLLLASSRDGALDILASLPLNSPYAEPGLFAKICFETGGSDFFSMLNWSSNEAKKHANSAILWQVALKISKVSPDALADWMNLNSLENVRNADELANLVASSYRGVDNGASNAWLQRAKELRSQSRTVLLDEFLKTYQERSNSIK